MAVFGVPSAHEDDGWRDFCTLELEAAWVHGELDQQAGAVDAEAVTERGEASGDSLPCAERVRRQIDALEARQRPTLT
jgi:hypothetical protein